MTDSEEVKVFKNGKVEVRRGIVTATVDPRKHGMERWTIVVRPPGRFKPRVGLNGYRVIYGPFAKMGPLDYSKDRLKADDEDTKAMTERDASLLAGDVTGKATTEDKLRMAQKMLDWYFSQESGGAVMKTCSKCGKQLRRGDGHKCPRATNRKKR